MLYLIKPEAIPASLAPADPVIARARRRYNSPMTGSRCNPAKAAPSAALLFALLLLGGCLAPVHAERLAMTRFEPTADGFVLVARVPHGRTPDDPAVAEAHRRWLLEHLMLGSFCLKGYTIESARVVSADTGDGRTEEIHYRGRCP